METTQLVHNNINLLNFKTTVEKTNINIKHDLTKDSPYKNEELLIESIIKYYNDITEIYFREAFNYV